MKKTGAEILCESLLQENVNVIFGFPGGAVLIEEGGMVLVVSLYFRF